MKKTSRGALGLLGAVSLAVVLVATSGSLSAAEETAEAPKPLRSPVGIASDSNGLR